MFKFFGERGTLALIGLALALATGCQTRTVVVEGARKGYVVVITHGPKDADRVMLALTTATRLPKGDNHVWFAIDGGQVCKKADAEKLTSPLFTKQRNAFAVIEQLRGKGVAVHI
jgi:predicted peroxiredoxin